MNSIKKISEKQKADFNIAIKELKELNDATINNLVNDYFTKDVDEKVKHSLAGAWLESMRAGRENAKKIMSVKKDITTIDDVTITNEMFNQWVERYGLVKSEELNQTSKKKLLEKLRGILTEGIEEGDSVEVLKKKLKEGAESVYEELSTVRAKMIARTETGSSVNIGQVATYKASGVEQKEWLSTFDNRTRDSHLAMAGKIANIDETFEVENMEGGIDNMLYPLDPNGSAGNTVNCRCTILPVIQL